MPLPPFTTRVHGQHQHLTAEAVRDAFDQAGVVDRRGVDPHLVGAAPQQTVHILRGSHAAAHRQRDEQLLGGPGDDVIRGLAVRAGCGDVQERQLVGTLPIVFGRQFHRVAGIAQVLEMHALDHASGIDIQAGDDSYGQ